MHKTYLKKNHLNSMNPVTRVQYKERVYIAKYIHSLNGLALYRFYPDKDAKQLDANSNYSKSLINFHNITWGY